MKSIHILCVTTALGLSLASTAVFADERAPAAALTGQVTSDAEGAMEGVVVTARKDGSIVSTSASAGASPSQDLAAATRTEALSAAQGAVPKLSDQSTKFCALK